MEFLKSLISDESCGVDGTASLTNPVATLLNKACEGVYEGDEQVMVQMNMNAFPSPEERVIIPNDTASLTLISDHVTIDPDQHEFMVAAQNRSIAMDGAVHMQQMHMQQMHMQQMHMQQMHMQQMHMMRMQQEHQDWAEKDMNAMRFVEHEDEMHRSVYVSDEGFDNIEELDDAWDTLQGKEDGGGPSKAKYREEWTKLQERLEGLDKKVTTVKYIFSKNNPYIEEEATTQRNFDEDPSEEELFLKGVELYQTGDIKEAILAFEGGVQKRSDNDECWRYLGMCHAENDEDKQAIACLQKAIEIDPYNLESLLILGTSYVNELDSEKALRMLQAWIAHNPRFYGLQVTPDIHSDGTLMDEVMQLVLAAHQHAPEDLDIKVLMGVLYNVSSDFESAGALLSEAVHSRGEQVDFNLLNKLGATLANSGKSEQALPIYKQALEKRPNYARGWLNLGISLANLNRYQDAAKAYVQALHLNPRARHIWGYLRVVLTCLEELDLVELCGKEDISSVAPRLSLKLDSRGQQPIPDSSLLTIL